MAYGICNPITHLFQWNEFRIICITRIEKWGEVYLVRVHFGCMKTTHNTFREKIHLKQKKRNFVSKLMPLDSSTEGTQTCYRELIVVE